MAKYKKRVTLHPLKEDGTMDLDTNLYPKTFLDGIVDRDGNEVDVALKEEIPTDVVTHNELEEGLNTKQDTLISGENIKTISSYNILGDGNIQLTKEDVGLNNVDNTSDADKPVSTAQQEALDLKANKSVVDNHIADTANPHNVTKSQVGLGNVDNTSDVDKPISTAQQQALNSKVNNSEVSIYAQDNTIVKRTTGGKVDIRVNVPQYDDEPASKNYVDNHHDSTKADVSELANYVTWSNVSQNAGGPTVVQRKDDSSVDIRVPLTPTYDNEPSSKQYVDNHHDSTKADKSELTNYVPWTSVSYDAYGDTLVRRKSDSKVDIRVPEPTYGDEPASKNYVDTNKGTKLYKHTITGMGGAFQGLTLEIISLDSQPYNSFQRMLYACDEQLSTLLFTGSGTQKVKMVYFSFNGSYFKLYFGGYYTNYGGSTAPELVTYELGVSDITPTDVVTEL